MKKLLCILGLIFATVAHAQTQAVTINLTTGNVTNSSPVNFATQKLGVAGGFFDTTARADGYVIFYNGTSGNYEFEAGGGGGGNGTWGSIGGNFTNQTFPGIANAVLLGVNATNHGVGVAYNATTIATVLGNVATLNIPLTVPSGGTGLVTITANSAMYGNGTGAVKVVGPTASSVSGWNGTSIPAAITFGSNLSLTGNVLDAIGSGSGTVQNLNAGGTGFTVSGNGSATLTFSGNLNIGNIAPGAANTVFVTNATATNWTAILPNAVQDNITRLGAVTVGSLGTAVTGFTQANGTANTTLATTLFVSNATAALGTIVNSITGTANQITSSASTGAVTLAINSTFVFPGTAKLGGNFDMAGFTQTNGTINATLGNNTIVAGSNITGNAVFKSTGVNSASGHIITQGGNGTPPTGAPTALYIVDSDAANFGVVNDAFGHSGGIFFGRRSQGTSGTPTATTSGLTLLDLAAAGYGTTGWGGEVAGMRVRTEQDFTDTAQGTGLHFFISPNGTTTQTDVLVFHNDGQASFSAVPSAISSGFSIPFVITTNHTDTGTSGATDFEIDRIDTSHGSGAQNLVLLTVNGTGKFNIDTSGDVFTSGFYASSGSAFIGNALNVTGISTLTGVLNVLSSTASTNTISGAIVDSGGLGVSGNTFIGGTLNVTGASTLTGAVAMGSTLITTGNITDSALSSGNVYITGNGTKVLTGTAATNSTILGRYSDGTFTAFALGANMTMNATTIDATVGSGSGTVTSVTSADTNIGVATTTTTPVLTLNTTLAGATFTFNGTTASTTTLTGTIVTSGGIGISKAAFIGGTLNVTGASTLAGDVNVSSSTASTTTTSGAIITAGGLGVAKNLFVGGTSNVTGNATITGTRLNFPTNVSMITGPMGGSFANRLAFQTNDGTFTKIHVMAGETGTANSVAGFNFVAFNSTANTPYLSMELSGDNAADGNTGMFLNLGHLGSGLTGNVYVWQADGGNIAVLTKAGIFTLNATTASTSTTTGALVVGGGLGVAGNINGGGTLTTTGAVNGQVITVSANIDAKTSGNTTIYTPTSGKNATIVSIAIENLVTTSVTIPAQVTFSAGATTNDVTTSLTLTTPTAGQEFKPVFATEPFWCNNSAPLTMRITVGSTATTHTIKIIVTAIEYTP